MTSFFPEPSAKLVNAFDLPYDNAVAAARTCYSSKMIYAEDVNKDEITRQRRDTIAQSIFKAGHHTTLQHATFQFALEKVSRQCIWSFLHSHAFYNSEQVSQRYVAVAPENFSVPELPETSRELYLSAISLLMGAYTRLQELLRPTVEAEFRRIFPSRDLNEKRWQSAIKKRGQEAARYCLPVATHAHLYHTISGITLLRYLRICENYDVPREQSILVRKMADQVQKWDLEFLKNAQDPLPIEETPEYAFLNKKEDSPADPQGFLREFDQGLDDRCSLLVDWNKGSDKTLAQAVRNVLGIKKNEMPDREAIDLVLNPMRNAYLSETMNLTHHGKITRTLAHPHFTFRKKISHTADSQDQRHRTIPGSRPILARHFSPHPDYIVPALIEASPLAKEFYCATMDTLWERMDLLLNQGTAIESVLYLLPNAFPIRFEESGTLLDFHHKWVHRLCYTAQEEIWKASKEEVEQVENLFPSIGQYLRAPCSLRKSADRKPFCPEGERFCGIAVWNQPLESYQRIL